MRFLGNTLAQSTRWLLCLLTAVLIAHRASAYDQMFLRRGENNVTSAFYDPSNQTAYFSTTEHAFPYTLETSSSSVVRIKLTPFSRTGTLVLKAGENPISTSLFDAGSDHGYVGVYGDPNRGIPARLIQMSLTNMQRLQHLELEGNDFGLYSAIEDPRHHVAYFGTKFGKVTAVSLAEFQILGSLGLTGRNNPVQCGVIDALGQFGYFGTGSGDVLQVRLADLSPVGSLTLYRDDKGFGSALLEPGGKTAILITRGFPATLIRLNLTTFRPEGSLTLEPGDENVKAAFLDHKGTSLLLVTATTPGRIISIRLNPLARTEAVNLPTSLGRAAAIVFDAKRRILLWGTDTTPPRLVRWPLSGD